MRENADENSDSGIYRNMQKYHKNHNIITTAPTFLSKFSFLQTNHPPPPPGPFSFSRYFPPFSPSPLFSFSFHPSVYISLNFLFSLIVLLACFLPLFLFLSPCLLPLSFFFHHAFFHFPFSFHHVFFPLSLFFRHAFFHFPFFFHHAFFHFPFSI